jgi:hypothetical protein
MVRAGVRTFASSPLRVQPFGLEHHAAMFIRLALAAKTELRIGNRSSETTWHAGLEPHERLLSTSVRSHPRPGAGRERMRRKHDLQDERSNDLLELDAPLERLKDRLKGRRARSDADEPLALVEKPTAYFALRASHALVESVVAPARNIQRRRVLIRMVSFCPGAIPAREPIPFRLSTRRRGCLGRIATVEAIARCCVKSCHGSSGHFASQANMRGPLQHIRNLDLECVPALRQGGQIRHDALSGDRGVAPDPIRDVNPQHAVADLEAPGINGHLARRHELYVDPHWSRDG